MTAQLQCRSPLDAKVQEADSFIVAEWRSGIALEHIMGSSMDLRQKQKDSSKAKSRKILMLLYILF